MLKGDLASCPLATVLQDLADGAATGCVHLADPAGESAKVYLRGGAVYAAVAPGRRPELGPRLVSSGDLGPEALAEALEAQRTELQGWRLGELLVHLGYVDQPVVEAFVNEQLRESLGDLLPWGSGSWRFRVNERTREDVAAPVPVDDLLADISDRRATWASFADGIGGAEAVPMLSAGGTSDSELEIDPDSWSLLCKVDGLRSVVDLARECGFTLYEAGRVVHGLVAAGLLEVDEAADPELEPSPEPFVPADVASRLASAFRPPAPDVPADLEPPAEPRHLEQPLAEGDVDGSISRVSVTLAALLGPATAGDDVFAAPLHRPSVAAPTPVPEDPEQAERTRREAVRRERDAAELATAQAELEAARAEQESQRAAALPDGHVAEVVDLDAARQAAAAEAAARLAQERAAAEAHAAEQLRAEQEAWAAEQVRIEQERRDAEELIAELAAEEAQQEAARQEAARQEEQARQAQEQLDAQHAALEAQAAEDYRLAEIARNAEQARLAEQERLERERWVAEHDAQRRAAEALAEQEAAAAAAEFASMLDAFAVADPEPEPLQPEPVQVELTDVDVSAQLDGWGDPRAEAEAQAAAFAELSAAASSEPPAPEPVAVQELPAFELDEDDAEDVRSYAHDTDTAALLRELSSLGVDDDPPPVPAPRPPTARPVQVTPARKRKGLFGR